MTNIRKQVNLRLDDSHERMLQELLIKDQNESLTDAHLPLSTTDIVKRAIKESYAIHVNKNASNAYLGLIEDQLNKTISDLLATQNAIVEQVVRRIMEESNSQNKQLMMINETALRIIFQSFENFKDPQKVRNKCENISDSWTALEQYVEEEVGEK